MHIFISILLSLTAIVFIIQLFITEYILSKKRIDLGGKPPINVYLFLTSKYLVIVVWIGMILELFDIQVIFHFHKYTATSYTGMILWITGFLLLYIGRFSLGKSFRIGVANEKTKFIVKGIYRFSRNPMYLGLYLTFIGCIIYSLNPIYAALSLFIITVHHHITLNEEKAMCRIYGNEYKKYCAEVRRYL
jgi:protein-S-isoprenylcysteine O-methyltransferase Ste14